jgi:hypothetical protein
MFGLRNTWQIKHCQANKKNDDFLHGLLFLGYMANIIFYFFLAGISGERSISFLSILPARPVSHHVG